MELTAEVPSHIGARSLRVAEASSALHATPRDLWDRHGDSAHLLACALLGAEETVAEVVRLAMADLASSRDVLSDDEARRVLACSVYRHARELPSRPAVAQGLPRAMVWLSRLARLQRASLALCVYGGLTHREAATLLDVPPATVADLLTAGLRELSRLAAEDAASCA